MGVLHESRGEHDASYRSYRAALKADRDYEPARHNMQRYYERFTFGRSRRARRHGRSETVTFATRPSDRPSQSGRLDVGWPVEGGRPDWSPSAAAPSLTTRSPLEGAHGPRTLALGLALFALFFGLVAACDRL